MKVDRGLKIDKNRVVEFSRYSGRTLKIIYTFDNTWNFTDRQLFLSAYRKAVEDRKEG